MVGHYGRWNFGRVLAAGARRSAGVCPRSGRFIRQRLVDASNSHVDRRGGPESPPAASIFAVLRYFIMLAGLYVILDFSESGFLAALAGCFVHIIAVVLEVVFELTYGTS